jgi:hypothetical protein
MGFGLGSIGGAFKKVFKKGKSFLKGAGGFAEGVGEWIDVTNPKGFGNIITFGTLAQNEARKLQEKAAKEAQARYLQEIENAKKIALKLEQEEEERKRRLAAQGTKMPSTATSGYLGVTGGANVRRTLLG